MAIARLRNTAMGSGPDKRLSQVSRMMDSTSSLAPCQAVARKGKEQTVSQR